MRSLNRMIKLESNSTKYIYKTTLIVNSTLHKFFEVPKQAECVVDHSPDLSVTLSSLVVMERSSMRKGEYGWHFVLCIWAFAQQSDQPEQCLLRADWTKPRRKPPQSWFKQVDECFFHTSHFRDDTWALPLGNPEPLNNSLFQLSRGKWGIYISK